MTSKREIVADRMIITEYKKTCFYWSH